MFINKGRFIAKEGVRRMKIFKKVPYIQQTNYTECGLCCVGMILGYYGVHFSLGELRNSIHVGRDGANLKQLKDFFENNNFEARAFACNISILYKVKLPAILFWEDRHFVVLEKICSHSVYIVDPAYGRRMLKIDEFQRSFSQKILLVIPKGKIEKKHPKKHKKLLYSLVGIKVEKKRIFIIIMFSLLSYFFSISIPIFMQKFIDKTISSNMVLYNYIIIIIVLILLNILVSVIRSKNMISFRIIIDKYINGKLFEHLLKVPYDFYDTRAQNSIIYTLNSCSIIRDIFVERLFQCALDVGAGIFIFIYLLNKSLKLTIIITILIFIDILLLLFSKSRFDESNNSKLIEQGRLQGLQTEAIYSILGIKMSGIGEGIFRNWQNNYLKLGEAYKRSEYINLALNSVQELIKSISPIAVLVGGLYFVNNGIFSFGEVITFYTLNNTFFSICSSIFTNWTSFIMGRLYLNRIFDIFDTEVEKNDEKNRDIILNGEILLKDVDYSYNNSSHQVLSNINLEIAPGECIAIVGESGSGKSTLAKIIAGLYQPSAGEVFYNGITSKQLNLESIRKQMGIVPQEVSLFNKTILENIKMGDDRYSLEDVKKVCRIANIHKEIEKMPLGYNTIISEMGMNISGGQRQRIILARALLANPRVLLLDEATSSLDSINEAEIMQYLEHIGCTRIIVAHRLSTVKFSTKIVVLDNGHIVEIGSHDELIKSKGKYFELYSKQKGSV